MNKRIILNLMIFAMLTFYLIFSVVYNRVLTKPDIESQPDAEVWEQPFLIPEPWTLIRFEMLSFNMQLNEQGKWISDDSAIDSGALSNIANSWQNLRAKSIDVYTQLPLEGKTLLIFIQQDSQPLVFRILEQGSELQFYRMMDQRRFSFPISSKPQFLLDSEVLSDDN